MVVGSGLALANVLDPERTLEFDRIELQNQAIASGKWLGAVFGGSYAALYARFSSQWSYLAGMYNQIKAAQSREGVDKSVIAEWRAAFIEDCEDLHLLRKAPFASAVDSLLNGDDEQSVLVQTVFDKFSPGGFARRVRIAGIAREACAAAERALVI